MASCPECQQLREATADLFSEYVRLRDDLAMTRKNDKEYGNRVHEVGEVRGKLKEARKQEEWHRHTHYDTLSDEETLNEALRHLRARVVVNDEAGVQQIIFDLGAVANGFWRSVPDQIVDGILSILREPTNFNSSAAGYALSYFQFESERLTPKQKTRCLEFLKECGDSFTDVHAVQVVTELRYDKYGKWLR